MDADTPRHDRRVLLAGLFVSATALVLIVLYAFRSFFSQLFDADFMPHGHCYMWRPDILWLHVISDSLVTLSYFAIPVCLVFLVKRRRGLRFRGAFWLFSLFIFFCGCTHLLEIYSVWQGAYRLTGMMKLATGLVSVATAIYLIRAMPQLLRIPLPKEMRAVQDRLGERERLYETILKAGVDGFLTIEKRGEGDTARYLLSEFNEVAAQELAVDREQASGMDIELAMPLARSLALKADLEEASRTGRTIAGDRLFADEEGKERFFSFRLAPTESLFVLFYLDRTEIYQTEAALKRSLEEKASEALMRSDINAARAQAAISAAANGMLIVDSQGKMVQANTQLQLIFGYAESELVGRSVEMLVPEQVRSGHQGLRENYHAHPQTRAMGPERQLEGRRKDGSLFPVEVGLNPFETPEGRFVIASVLDVSERIAARRALEESELRFQQAVKGGRVGIWHWIDVESPEQWWSDSFYQVLGFEVGEIEAHADTFRELLHPEDRERTFDLVSRCVAGEDAFAIDYRIKRKDGRYRWFYGAGVAVHDKAAGRTSMIGSMQDIQFRKDAEDQVRSAKEAVEAKNREMEEMMYAVSHDLKSPLVSIRGLIQILQARGGADGDPNQDFVQRIDRLASHMGDLITDLLEMSRVGHASENIESVRSADVVEDVLQGLLTKTGHSNWEVVVGKDLPVLRVDRKRLWQLLQNLISNALKYGTNENGNGGRIEIGSASDVRGVTLFVRDFGEGIEIEQQERIFQVFKRLNTKKEGTGVGLAIVKKIMEHYEGSVTIDSALGQGSTFSLHFPKERWVRDEG
ncbi:PAS domain S-box protein [Pelagicoccus sp. SDUM812003]|uniref:PAS domain-containing sensor histidine kinase n=1 Tax=Pelagicoccus sp. SDUM812003 TaxID=3041267 RepID=UPI00280F965C|nr:PAS domain S-box protein [Pelagicoccus sp. SDUM812003]MDQ8203065.1 PAS domain S-box protein [Pelagicoccus sp. SDUM812003]